MRMIKKILGTIFDYPILNVHEKAVNEEIGQDYWDEYFSGDDILAKKIELDIEDEVKDYIQRSYEANPQGKCRIYRLENYK